MSRRVQSEGSVLHLIVAVLVTVFLAVHSAVMGPQAAQAHDIGVSPGP